MLGTAAEHVFIDMSLENVVTPSRCRLCVQIVVRHSEVAQVVRHPFEFVRGAVSGVQAEIHYRGCSGGRAAAMVMQRPECG